MGAENILEVINREGWQKQYPLNKTIIHIGSDPRNDIVLEEKHGSGVAPLHLQLIATSETGQGYRLVNLGHADILLGANGERTLPPRATLDLTEGDTISVGDFTLTYRGQSAPVRSGIAGSSQRIGLSLVIPRTQIAPHQTVNGVITVRNLGDKGGVKINLELEGLEPECYHLEPGPLLSSGAEKEVFFSIHHRGHKPMAGSYPIKIHATAPNAYPTEFVTIAQTIEILPFYSHKLRLMAPETAPAKKPQPEESARPLTPPVEPAPVPETPQPIITPVTEILPVRDETPAQDAAPAPATTSTDDWWAAGAEPEAQPTLASAPSLLTPIAVEPMGSMPAGTTSNGEIPRPNAEVIEVEAKELPPVSASSEPLPSVPLVETEASVIEVVPSEGGLPVPVEPPEVEVIIPLVEEPVEPGVQAGPPAPPLEEPLMTPAEAEPAPAAEPPPAPVMAPEPSKPEDGYAEVGTRVTPPVETEAPEPAAPVTKPRRPRVKTSTHSKVKVEQKPVVHSPAEDWWGVEPEPSPATSSEKPAVIKLKAAAQAVAKEPKTQTDRAAQAEDWWDETE